MQYKVVCIKEFAGLHSNGQLSHIPKPILNAIYTVIDENIDGMGIHALILRELNFKAGYNSNHFRPLEPTDMKFESDEEILENILSTELVTHDAL